MVVVAIAGILVLILSDTYTRWSTRYKVESAIRNVHARMMEARTRSIARGRTHFVRVAAANCQVVEDTSPAPNGNGTLESGDEAVASEDLAVDHGFRAGASFRLFMDGSADNTLTINRDGTMDAAGNSYLRLETNMDADRDCIDISGTRLRLGKYNASTQVCNPR